MILNYSSSKLLFRDDQRTEKYLLNLLNLSRSNFVENTNVFKSVRVLIRFWSTRFLFFIHMYKHIINQFIEQQQICGWLSAGKELFHCFPLLAASVVLCSFPVRCLGQEVEFDRIGSWSLRFHQHYLSLLLLNAVAGHNNWASSRENLSSGFATRVDSNRPAQS